MTTVAAIPHAVTETRTFQTIGGTLGRLRARKEH